MMNRWLYWMILCLLLSSAGQARGQGVSAGTFHSPKGIGLTADIERGDWLSTLTLAADLDGVLTGNARQPGLRASFLYCRLWPGPSGRVKFFAGPGATFGYLRDRSAEFGPTFCLSGRTGVLADFPGHIRTALSLTGDFGLQMQSKGGLERNVITWYRNGLSRAFYPELRVLYRFGSPDAEKRPERSARITFGVEWGWYARIRSAKRYEYQTEGGFYDGDNSAETGFSSNGEVLAHIGRNVLPWLNAALFAGFSGIDQNRRVFPASLRLTFFRKAFLALADFGAALNTPSQNGWIAKAGIGCRLGLSGKSGLEFKLIVRAAMTHPELYDPENGNKLPKSRVFRNDRIAESVGLTMAIVL